MCAELLQKRVDCPYFFNEIYNYALVTLLGMSWWTPWKPSTVTSNDETCSKMLKMPLTFLMLAPVELCVRRALSVGSLGKLSSLGNSLAVESLRIVGIDVSILLIFFIYRKFFRFFVCFLPPKFHKKIRGR